jgi:hypothetical protein
MYIVSKPFTCMHIYIVLFIGFFNFVMLHFFFLNVDGVQNKTLIWCYIHIHYKLLCISIYIVIYSTKLGLVLYIVCICILYTICKLLYYLQYVHKCKR